MAPPMSPVGLARTPSLVELVSAIQNDRTSFPTPQKKDTWSSFFQARIQSLKKGSTSNELELQAARYRRHAHPKNTKPILSPDKWRIRLRQAEHNRRIGKAGEESVLNWFALKADQQCRLFVADDGSLKMFKPDAYVSVAELGRSLLGSCLLPGVGEGSVVEVKTKQHGARGIYGSVPYDVQKQGYRAQIAPSVLVVVRACDSADKKPGTPHKSMVPERTRDCFKGGVSLIDVVEKPSGEMTPLRAYAQKPTGSFVPVVASASMERRKAALAAPASPVPFSLGGAGAPSVMPHSDGPVTRLASKKRERFSPGKPTGFSPPQRRTALADLTNCSVPGGSVKGSDGPSFPFIFPPPLPQTSLGSGGLHTPSFRRTSTPRIGSRLRPTGL